MSESLDTLMPSPRTPLAYPAVDFPAGDFMTAALRSWLVNHLLTDADLQELPYLLLELAYEDVPAPEACRDFLKREMSRLTAEGEQLRLIRLCEGLIQFYLLQHPRECPELDQLNRYLPPGLAFSTLSGRLLFEPEHYYQPHNLFMQERAHWVRPEGTLSSPTSRPTIAPCAAAARPADHADLPASSEGAPPEQSPSRLTEQSPSRLTEPAGTESVVTESVVAEAAGLELRPAAATRRPAQPRQDEHQDEQQDEQAHERAEALAGVQADGHQADEQDAVALAGPAGRGGQFRDIRKRRLRMLKEWESGTGESL